MVSGMMHSSTVARLVDVPARGRRLNAIFPNGHDKSLSNAGDTIEPTDAAAVAGSAKAAFGASGIVEVAIAVDIAAMFDRKLRLEGGVVSWSSSDCVDLSDRDTLICF